jgi:hypothetical protein
MEPTSPSSFLDYWHYAMIVGAVVMASLAIVIFIVHNLRISTIRDYKGKYDYINTYEIKNYKKVFLCFGIAAMLVINLYGMGKLVNLGVWFFVRLFISVAGGTLVAYVAFLILEYYYPTVLNRKLQKWRYMPRVGKSGNKLRLLGEEEEDVHLEEGMRKLTNTQDIFRP